MKNEWIFWALLVIVVVLFSLYLKLNSTSTIGMFVGISNNVGNNLLYPFQRVIIPINVTNTGSSAITNVVFTIKINGNTSTSYQLTIPVGKNVNIQYNFTPKVAGMYNISVVADPADIYQIANRNNAHNSTFINVSMAQNAMPYLLLPNRNVTSSGSLDLGRAGFLASSFIYQTYGIPSFAPTSKYDAFVFSVLNLTQQYVRNVSTAYAGYANGDYAYSVWTSGYLSPRIMGVAASAKGYQAINYTLRGRNVTFVDLGNDTTYCSWYDMGWIKNVVYHNLSFTCLSIYDNTTATLTSPLQSMNSTVYSKTLAINGSIFLGNYTSRVGNDSKFGSLAQVGSEFIATSIGSNSTIGTKCYGVINTVNGTSYCSTYILPLQGGIQGIALLRTSSQIGNLNASALSVINNSRIFQAVPIAIGFIKSLNLTGQSAVFNSGFSNSCNFLNSFACNATNFRNGTMSLSITNNLNSTARINSMYCRTRGNVKSTPLNFSLAAHSTANANVTCYTNGNVIAGVPLNLKVSLLLNYTSLNITNTVNGNATVNVFSS